MKKSSGFTLIEILVVVTIIGLLTLTAVVTYGAFLKQSRDAKRKADLGQVAAALEMYRSNSDTYPVGSVW
ncbi:MAG: prepilin-type N-terminal cleavage/methylation domain-containing protein, partial [Patescibacteria group bacterium]